MARTKDDLAQEVERLSAENWRLSISLQAAMKNAALSVQPEPWQAVERVQTEGEYWMFFLARSESPYGGIVIARWKADQNSEPILSVRYLAEMNHEMRRGAWPEATWEAITRLNIKASEIQQRAWKVAGSAPLPGASPGPEAAAAYGMVRTHTRS